MTAPTGKQLDTLREVVNIGIGKAASILNGMLESHIELEVPSIIMFDPENPGEELPDVSCNDLSSVQLDFHGPFSGSSALVFPSESVGKLVTALTGEEPGSEGFDEETTGTLYEVGNILINAVMGSIANLLAVQIDFLPPNYKEGKFSDLIKLKDSKEDLASLLIRANFNVQEPLISGNIFLVFELDSFGELLTAIDNL
ncbi:MAG: chemotaxis protein CheC [Candidatus Scalindua sp.]|nr:chemotaxis protein CheC [Candidatus Scalindua sp.]MBT5305424.1 chemotaxis protein CheC [Candidatus Scalindua sp.]MBT6053121.1 chemotaxis protein CheC [Candidatus Scalindua sp.]MBT6226408.1 chemotaxis protein CheC [Candidatus Scalindua sp.]MBT6561209.1 chemotaxis protein CheC [Candidatus Scalindua sp.]